MSIYFYSIVNNSRRQRSRYTALVAVAVAQVQSESRSCIENQSIEITSFHSCDFQDVTSCSDKQLFSFFF